MDSLFALFDQFFRINLAQYPQNQQAYLSESWEQFLCLLQTQPLDYGKIYTLINRINYEDLKVEKNERQSSSQRYIARNITAASSPRIVSSSVSKNSTNVLSKIAQLDSVASPKIAVSNLASQQSLTNKTSLQQNVKQQQMTDEFNRHLLLSKIKELQFNYSVSTDKLYAIARISHSRGENQPTSKSPIKYPLSQYINKSRGSNHSAEHYKIVV
ncbi:unnamed protein product (macronuclear) [Paramecium tetraurelia]|uniref:Uncharacterized protein n=2 Tax=Paramecium TaxID=5884 RepID=A0D7I5_PARTE|nr:uncharacterized protein GSPATT00002044001 [Paramecium tetraurelia]CAD8134876.1 unnamed protein product [Paramecium octaurelia]CAK79002.1 unnamed protein product [Paramecium tetraurelia]|eukprot:XP_001446399.1 hypothetical protein (macronuclear) [Paramecium tetraurelia strain d4-2]